MVPEGEDQEPTIGLSPEFNWCDEACERCPIRERCAMFIRERGQRWAHEVRGRDPDDPEVIARDLEALYAVGMSAIAELRDELAAAGDLPVEEPSFLGRRMDETVLALLKAVGPGKPYMPTLFRMMRKVARLHSHLKLEPIHELETLDGTIWARDGAPVVFLIERLIRDVAASLAEDKKTDALLRLAQLEVLLDPIRERLEPYRAQLDALIAAGEAPSPFSIRDER